MRNAHPLTIHELRTAAGNPALELRRPLSQDADRVYLAVLGATGLPVQLTLTHEELRSFVVSANTYLAQDGRAHLDEEKRYER